VIELLGHHKDCIKQLLKLRVPCLSIIHDLTDEVHVLLFDFHRGIRLFNDNNYADNCVGSCNV
jgi:hypothetical protein